MKMESLLILGRQPALGVAELESLYGATAVRPVGGQAALVDVDPCLLAFDRLGGSTKFGKVLAKLDTVSWKDVEKFLVEAAPPHSRTMPEGKMQLGLSLYGFQETVQRIMATGLHLKKVIQKTGRSVRLIPNKTPALNSAQAIHNHLTGPNGWELLFVLDGRQIIIAQTVKVQDIAAYTQRDRARPKRDTRVGMLPPKLAQIIVNMAAGLVPEESRQSICEILPGEPLPLPVKSDQILLDPFCGTGVILQEAKLMGFHVYGSDVDPRMIEYSTKNLDWFLQQFHLAQDTETSAYRLEVADATSHTWDTFTFIASETYLGRPFTSLPPPPVLAQTMSDCNMILKKFLQNLAVQIPPGTQLCLAVPAWQVKQNQFQHLPLVDQLDELGYTQVSFEHVQARQLIYYRPDQIVARELLVIRRK